MKLKLIRLSSFETNSSSAHSIVLLDGAEMVNVVELLGYDPATLTDKELLEKCEGLAEGPEDQIGYGTYGWGYETYASLEAMADYCLVQLIDYPSSYDRSGQQDKLLEPGTWRENSIHLQFDR